MRTQKELAQRARPARPAARAPGRGAEDTVVGSLAELYKADKPDLMTVVLNSDGFADLLERGEFLGRIQNQDNTVITLVRDAKADATATTPPGRLDKLEARQQQLTAIVLKRRDEVAVVKNELIGTRVGYAQTRAGKANALTKVRTERKSLESHLSGLQKDPPRSRQSCGRCWPAPAGPIKGGSGRFIWPVNGTLTSPFCESRSWESLSHPGIDIAVPTGTPITRAADGGRVAIAGWVGGYGNYTCIQHTASLSTCFGHSRCSRCTRTRTSQTLPGQIIGLSGSTGHSTGPPPHFEVRIDRRGDKNPMKLLVGGNRAPLVELTGTVPGKSTRGASVGGAQCGALIAARNVVCRHRGERAEPGFEALARRPHARGWACWARPHRAIPRATRRDAGGTTPGRRGGPVGRDHIAPYRPTPPGRRRTTPGAANPTPARSPR